MNRNRIANKKLAAYARIAFKDVSLAAVVAAAVSARAERDATEKSLAHGGRRSARAAILKAEATAADAAFFKELALANGLAVCEKAVAVAIAHFDVLDNCFVAERFARAVARSANRYRHGPLK